MTAPAHDGWTVRQNWNRVLWARLWPTRAAAWGALEREMGMSRAEIKKQCDWTLVRARLVEVVK